MAEVCAACGSPDTGAMLDTFVCHVCGAVSNYQGEVVQEPRFGATSTETVGADVPPEPEPAPAEAPAEPEPAQEPAPEGQPAEV